MNKFWKAFDRLVCGHLWWRKQGDNAMCGLCGKIKPITKLKKKDVLYNW